jgi:DNA-binding MarR family transcriptional regulator
MLNSIQLTPFGVDFSKVVNTKGNSSSGARSSTPSGLLETGSELTMSKADPLHNLWLIADKFREVYDSIPIRWIQTFLYVAMHQDSEDLTQARISEVLGAAQGVVSKFLNKMSDKGGIGLIHMERSVHDDRFKNITLTVKGKKLFNDIQTILQKG